MNEKAFEYSQEWYDITYHIGRIGIDKRTFDDVNIQYEKHGYRKRLNEVLNKINVPDEEITWLEVGCHLGLTAYWVLERYPQVFMYMFDFSDSSINWCLNTCPYQNRTTIWKTNVDNIRLNNDSLDGKFDFVSCIDVTEHLPDQIYQNLINELYRVMKVGGFLILMQGISIVDNPEHIHVLPERVLVSDFKKRGFKLVKNLPHRHYLFQKK